MLKNQVVLYYVHRLAASLCLLAFSLFLQAQTDSIPQIDSTQVIVDSLVTKIDSTEVVKKKGLIAKLKDNTYPNPTRAAFLSLALPGAGQFYNKKYWKIPIVYAALGGLTIFAIDQQGKYVELRDEYIARLDTLDSTVPDPRLSTASDGTIKRLRNVYDKRRQQAYFGIVAGWALNAIDAFVDAHLFEFDVSEDLSMQIRPSLSPNTDFRGLRSQIQITLNINPKSKKIPLVFE